MTDEKLKQLLYEKYLTETKPNGTKVTDVLSRLGIHEFLSMGPDGEIRQTPTEAMRMVLLARYDKTGIFIDGNGYLSVFPLPMKTIRKKGITKETDKYDKAAIGKTARMLGIHHDETAQMQYMHAPHRPTPIMKNLERMGLDTDKLRETTAETLREPVFRMLDKIKKHDIAIGTCIHENELETDAYEPSPNIESEITKQYNKRLFMNQILSENALRYPNGSPARNLAETAILLYDAGTSAQNKEWREKNLTPSMRCITNMERLIPVITSVKRPTYERSPGNGNKRTFDTVRVWFGLVGKNTFPDRNRTLAENKKTLAEMALARIRDDRAFQSYGIPVNFLKLDHMGITGQDMLEFIFSVRTA